MQHLLSVDQVAERLGLHVRTVRGYIREGRLEAVRIGKQYRIAAADLDAFTGRPPAEPRPRVEVSAVVECDGLTATAADRLSTLLLADSALARDPAGEPLRIQAIYDDARARLKVIILGSPGDTATILQTIHDILTTEDGMFRTPPAAPR